MFPFLPSHYSKSIPPSSSVCVLCGFLQQNKTNILHQCFSITVQQLVNVFYYDVSRHEKKRCFVDAQHLWACWLSQIGNTHTIAR